MILTVSEQFSNTTTLDSELTGVPESGFYLNEVHPSVTVENLLSFLPNIDFTFSSWAIGDTYGEFTDTRNKTDIVLYDGLIYQSRVTANVGNQPDTSTTEWLVTNIESLRIKTFALASQDKALNKLNLNKRLITNQYLYNLVEQNDGSTVLLPNDYAAWVFEPRGSDYITFTINQIALQATTATPQSLYVVNQGQLLTTLTLNPNADGRLEFEESGYTFSGKGRYYFIIDAQNVRVDGSYIDPLGFDGFVACTAVGIGATPEDATFSYSQSNNGLNFNITVHLNPQIYIDNNLSSFGEYLQSAWELSVLKIFLANANNRINSSELMTLDKNELIFETKDLKSATVVVNYNKQKKKAIAMIDKTFDTQLIDDNSDFEITVTTI